MNAAFNQRSSWIGDQELEITKAYFRWKLFAQDVLQKVIYLHEEQYRFVKRIEVLEKLAGERNVKRATRHEDNPLNLPAPPMPPDPLNALHVGKDNGWSRKYQAEAIRLMAERVNALGLEVELLRRLAKSHTYIMGVDMASPDQPEPGYVVLDQNAGCEICNQCGHRAYEHGSKRCDCVGCDCNLNRASVQAGLGGPY